MALGKIIIGLAIIGLSTLGAWVLYVIWPTPPPPSPTVIIAGQEVTVQIVRTPEAMRRGLSGTPELKPGTGMLFVYDEYITPQFWMKDMYYPIDIIWIKDNRVAGFVENTPIPPQGQELPRYAPPEPINYVLEVPAGFVGRYGVEVGGVVEYD